MSLSVVVPALDAAATLPQTLETLAASEIIDEIIVADGGSRDDTAAVARAAGARVVFAPCGRGTQLTAGAEAAGSEWLLFVHADCRLAADWQRVVNAFITRPQAALRAGYFDLRLDDAAPAARRLERLVAWRCRVLALPYGDQGLLIARSLYDVVGGFRPIPLMEDVDLVRRLGRQRLAPLGAPITASARRYRGGGYWRRPLFNLFCLSLYFAGVSPARIMRLYG
ncbi:MAG: TIGR04283 family arsenosugar biosynthesis glycosyltransferase [Stellaceae bacterium]